MNRRRCGLLPALLLAPLSLHAQSQVTISSLSPQVYPANGQSFQLTVNGTGFCTLSGVRFNGFTVQTTFVSSIRLTANVSGGLVQEPGTVQVQVVNPAGVGDCPAGTATANMVIAPLLQITTQSLIEGALGSAYTWQVDAQGGYQTRFWSAVGLPTGLGINATSGIISGTPTLAGTFTVRVTVRDSINQTSERIFSLLIRSPLRVTGPASLPPGQVNTAYTAQQFTAEGGTPPYTWRAVGALPPGLSFNAQTGVLSGTPTQVGIFGFSIDVQDSTGARSQPAVYSIHVTIAQPQITTSTIPQGTAGQFYTTTFQATGGTPPYTWAALSTPPAGLTLTAGGVLSGTPTQAANVAFTVAVTDSQQQSQQRTYSLVINPATSTLQMVTATLPQGTVGQAYSFVMQASGGTGSYLWTAFSALPPGLTLSSFGLLSGTPTQAATTNVLIAVTDSAQARVERTFTLVIGTTPANLEITTPVLQQGAVGAFYSQQLSAAGGAPPYTWLATGLPAGLALSSNGLLSGTPSQSGLFSVSVQVADSAQRTATRGYSLSVTASTIQIQTGSLPDGQVGVFYQAGLTATGGTSPYNWTATGLPPGLVLTPSTGIISGTPTTPGSYSVAVQVFDSAQQSGSRTYFVNIGGGGVQIVQTSLPEATFGVTYTTTLTATGGFGSYAWSLVQNGQFLPPGLALNPVTGTIVGTPIQIGSFAFTIQVTATQGGSATRQFVINVVNRITISTQAVAPATLGVAYQQFIQASGGAAPYTWSATGLPPGLSIDPSNGVISGTPTQAGSFFVTVTVRDSQQQTAFRSYTIPVSSTDSLQIVTQTLPSATVGTPYETQIVAAGGTPPYNWVLGSTVPGLSLNNVTGYLSGTPALQGAFNVTVTVTDAAARTATRSYSLNVSAPFRITTETLPNGTVGVFYSAQLTVTGGSAPYTWQLVGALVPGLSVGISTGVLGGTPTQAGTYTANIVVTDSAGVQATRVLSVVITSGALTLNPTSLPAATQGVAYSVNFTASGGTPPYTYTAVTTLPAGLTLDAAGLLSGTVNQSGSFEIVIRASDSTGAQTTRNYALVVTAALRISPETLSPASAGSPYSVTLTATGGSPPYAWTVTGGALPDGLTLAGSTGVLSGTIAATGSFFFTVQVADSQGARASRSYTLTVGAALTLTTPAALPGGVVGSAYRTALAVSGGEPPYTFQVTAGALPDGVVLDAEGVLRGTPTRAQRYAFTIQVADAANRTAQKDFNLTVSAPLLRLTTEALPAGVVGTTYSQALAATGGVPPYSYSMTSGALPGGLTLASGGAISGTPTAAGTFSFTVRLADSAEAVVSRVFEIRIALPQLPPPQITGIPATAQPAAQLTPGLTLASAFPAALTGRLTLTFVPESGPDDPAVQFSSGGRTVDFTIPAGATQAQLPQGFGLQTGTVAGAITVTTTLRAGAQDVTPSPAPTQTVRVARAAPVIRSLRVNRTANGLELVVVGFSTAREVTQATVRFTAAAGAPVQTTDFTVALTQAFTQWYQGAASAPFGSQFTLTLPFTIQGNNNAVNAVSVTLTNGVGNSGAVSASF